MNFDQIGKQHVSRRRRPSPLRTKQRSPASFDSQFSQDVWPRPKSAGESAHSRNAKTSRQAGAAGFSIPLSWVKKLVIVAGVLVIGVVGTNWDSIAETFKLGEVSLQTLQDTAAYEIMEASYRPSLPGPGTEAVRQDIPQDIPIDVTEMFAWSEYQVREGDTISGIASRFSLSAGSIIAFNNIQEAWNIRAGKALKIPNMDGIPYTVGKNDSISKIAVKMKVPQNAILDANNILSDTIQAGQVLFIPGARMDANEFNRAFRRDATRRDVIILPVGGKVTSGYGWREDPVRPVAGEKRFHRGVDFIGRTGDPIKAAMKGTVLHVDNNPNLGNFIILKHDGGYQTLYAHLSAYSVKAGDTVNQGQEIGKIGATGYTTGPHLHFEVFRNGNRVDPLDLYK